MDFIDKVYHFKDIPKKRKYILGRLEIIYPDKKKTQLEKILDSIKIKFREQDERGASNHKTKEVFVTLKEIDRYNIKNEKDVIHYFEDAKSVITHETTHIFQNIFKVFPHVKYVDDANDIIYKKYVTDLGEIQARIEQIIDMMKYGFSKPEIINFLYSRKHMDRDLWKKLVSSAEDAFELEKN